MEKATQPAELKTQFGSRSGGSRAHPLHTALLCLPLVIVGMFDYEEKSKTNKQKNPQTETG